MRLIERCFASASITGTPSWKPMPKKFGTSVVTVFVPRSAGVVVERLPDENPIETPPSSAMPLLSQ